MLAQITNTPSFWQFLHYSKDSFSSIESCVKILAILFGGWWAYRAFHRRRERYPRAKINHAISYWSISENERLLRVTLNVLNDSDVLLKIRSGFTWVQQMQPWPKEITDCIQDGKPVVDEGETEVGWPLIKECTHKGKKEIEPKEADEIQMDFVLDKCYEQVLVYSFVENAAKGRWYVRLLRWLSSDKYPKKKKGIGWPVWTVVVFDKESKPESLIIMSEQIPDKRQGEAKSRPAPAVQPPPKLDVLIQSAPKEKPPPATPPPKKP
jgi:hypothetical protein